LHDDRRPRSQSKSGPASASEAVNSGAASIAMPSKIVFVRIMVDSRGDLDGRDFLPQFTHKGKARIVAQKVKETENIQFGKNDVRVMTDVTPSETVQLRLFLEFPRNRHES
jgi:hypothetical protein